MLSYILDKYVNIKNECQDFYRSYGAMICYCNYCYTETRLGFFELESGFTGYCLKMASPV